MKAFISMRIIGFLFIISGLLEFLVGLSSPNRDSILSPAILALGVIFVVSDTCKRKEYRNRNLYMIIMAAAIAVMLIGEYIFAPAQNRLIFYIFTVLLTVAFFGMSYFILTPESGTRKEKILSRIVSILFVLALFSLMAIVYNNFIILLVLGVFVVIMFVISRLIHRRKTLKA